ncbi:MAG: cobalamin biosynthesis central domain-containing protein [[Clostridium] scindens]
MITTATDIHHLWAVDKFAQENHLWIEDMAKAKRISARLLAGEEIIVDCTCEENQIKGEPPKGIRMMNVQSQEKEPDICIGIRKNPGWRHTLYLVPRAAVVGIGCRKGTDAGKIEKAIEPYFK